MRLLLAVLLLCSLTAFPTYAEEPTAGAADRIVLACRHVGIIDVAFDQNGNISRYRHENKASKADMRACLAAAHKDLLANPYPVRLSTAVHATQARIKKNGMVELF